MSCGCKSNNTEINSEEELNNNILRKIVIGILSFVIGILSVIVYVPFIIVALYKSWSGGALDISKVISGLGPNQPYDDEEDDIHDINPDDLEMVNVDKVA